MLEPKQLQWRCRRGVRELDVLLGQFLKDQYLQLDTIEKNAFERLLEVQDPTIMDWLFGKSSPDDKEISIIINKLKVYSRVSS
ncbi:MAG: succinate dehydrogenase assembly factor 2 [Acidiferrobacterales bacterium]|nr:succinate dehydrogenase assembly factor 2 [Acidiferrobacterales bacterium]